MSRNVPSSKKCLAWSWGLREVGSVKSCAESVARNNYQQFSTYNEGCFWDRPHTLPVV